MPTLPSKLNLVVIQFETCHHLSQTSPLRVIREKERRRELAREGEAEESLRERERDTGLGGGQRVAGANCVRRVLFLRIKECVLNFVFC
jgi:hypothetical protein